MKESKKRLLSLLVASIVVVTTPTVARATDDNPEPVAMEDTYSDATNYTVKEGDTLGNIAARFYGSASYYEDLARYNNIENPALIYVGQVIVIPKSFDFEYDYAEPEAETPVYPDDSIYIIRCGDNLEAIVNSYYGLKDRCVVDRVATYNGLADPNKIVVGQQIFLPCFDKLMGVTPKDYSQQYAEMSQRLAAMRRWREYWRHHGHPCVPVIPCPTECVPPLPEPEGCPCRKLVH